MFTDIAVVVGQVALICTSLVVIIKFPPFRFGVSRLIVRPATELLKETIDTAVEPMIVANSEDHALVREELQTVGIRLDSVSETVSNLACKVHDLSDQSDNTVHALQEELGLEV